jgi:hypothetical protein
MALFTHFLKRRKREKGQGWGYDTTQAAKKKMFSKLLLSIPVSRCSYQQKVSETQRTRIWR